MRNGGGGGYYECELLCALGIKQQAWRDVVEGLEKKGMCLH